MKDTQPLLSIIIPVLHLKRPVNPKRFFMRRQTIADTLNEIILNVQTPFEVIIVCNSADDDLRSFVISHPAVSRYCLNSENVGVSRAWNMGANLAKGDILCFLNDDVSIEKGGLEAMRNLLLSDEKIGQTGAAGCYWGANGFGGMVEGRGPRDVDAVLGYCFMLRASLFHKLGGVDINYSPAGCEDIDLSYKVREAGYRCVVDSDIPIKHHHHHGVSAQKVDITFMGETIDTETLHVKNTAYFHRKWANGFPSIRGDAQ